MTTRRTFLMAGLGGAAALAAGGAAWRWLGRAAPARFQLDTAGRELLTALVPAVLGPALPAQGGARLLAVAGTVERVRLAIAGLPPATQRELQDLFGLLSLAPARRLLTGLPAWRDATPGELERFLDGWRFHRFAVLRGAYHGLHDLILGSWYADPLSWAAIGYPGPLKELAS
ncbi:hypothetical protein IP92_04411 [Pseudoduganella flava]|uniref:Twin-arginine translocation pathway signal protein n=1 Tax=Pseudoduganella flava TaxID=871742 RepID=A0A562PJ25_9BURK|nr:hypothetical protein [Pseudoduganella flava]QGZ42036.1 hypothetical protein GO485_25310 [Pseudoduganella flava]TWI44461.1 hypothetical protein IP92_04411 [Pseudoduganella flava]